jgi:Ca-activated chloride channel family protein
MVSTAIQMTLLDFHFLRPLWLLALPLLALLILVLWQRQRRAAASIWRGLVDPHLLAHLLVGEEGRRRVLPLLLLGGGWTLVVLALAGPVWERLPQPVFSSTGQRVILLDLSLSMNAADLPPSRLARARFELLDLLRASSEGQVALLAFGSEPFVVSPLTGDARTIEAQVPQLTTDLIPVPGPRRTDLALKLAGEMLERARSRGGDLILITDGVGELAGSLDVARALQAAGHRLSVLAVGTMKGAPVPAAKGGFVKDGAGGIQVVRLDPERLRQLATAGKGRYLDAEVGERDTLALTEAGPRLGEPIESTALTTDQWREEGPWLLLILLPLAALAFRRGWLLPVVVLILCLPPRPGLAFDWQDLWSRPDQRAARQFESGAVQASAGQFQDRAWRAAASYRSGDFHAALDSLSGLKGMDADYNRGNALARLGQLQEAADAYEDVLRQAPDQADARHNLELVRKLIAQQNQPDQPNQPPEQSGQKQAGGEGAEPYEGGQGQSQDKPGTDDQKTAQDDQAAAPGAPEPPGEKTEKGETTSAENPKASVQAGDQAGQEAESTAASGSDSGSSDPPDASDFSQDARASGAGTEASEPESHARPALAREAGADQSDHKTDGQPLSTGIAQNSLTPQEREQQQAMEAQLRRVPDDPSGLLRQRFLLQHLRREGRLP